MAKRKPKIAEEDKPARIKHLTKMINDTAARLMREKPEPREVGHSQMKINKWRKEIARLNSSK